MKVLADGSGEEICFQPLSPFSVYTLLVKVLNYK